MMTAGEPSEGNSVNKLNTITVSKKFMQSQLGPISLLDDLDLRSPEHNQVLNRSILMDNAKTELLNH